MRTAKPTKTTRDAYNLARMAGPQHNEAIAYQIGRLIAADPTQLSPGSLLLSQRGIFHTAIIKALGDAAKRPAGPNAVCIALAKLIEPVSTVRHRKAPAKPRSVDLFGKALPRRNTSEKEDSVQARLVAMLEKCSAPNIYYFHPANGGFRSIRTAVRLKAQGVKPGTPDLIFIINGRTHGLELKRERGGVVSAVQKQARVDIIAAGGIHAVARGYDDAVAVLRSWRAIVTH